MSRSTMPRGWVRRGLAVVGLAVVALVAVVLVIGWTAFGGRVIGARRVRVEASPEWRDGRFHNPQPLENSWSGAIAGLFRPNPHGAPAGPLPVVATDPALFRTPPPTGLRVTWWGHSTTLVEVDGHRVLTDPMWGPRASPVPFAGPRRWYPPPMALSELPPIDAVVISHDHGALDHSKSTAWTWPAPWRRARAGDGLTAISAGSPARCRTSRCRAARCRVT